MMDRGGHHMMDGVHYIMDRVHHMMDGVHHMMNRIYYVMVFLVKLNPTRGRGADSARPEEKLRFWYILVIQLTRKNLTFPK